MQHRQWGTRQACSTIRDTGTEWDQVPMPSPVRGLDKCSCGGASPSGDQVKGGYSGKCHWLGWVCLLLWDAKTRWLEEEDIKRCLVEEDIKSDEGTTGRPIQSFIYNMNRSVLPLNPFGYLGRKNRWWRWGREPRRNQRSIRHLGPGSAGNSNRKDGWDKVTGSKNM